MRGDIHTNATDLALRSGTCVCAVSFDVSSGQPDAFFDTLGVVPRSVVMVAGLFGDQVESAADDLTTARVMDSNYSGPSRDLLAATRRMATVPNACIIGISSVAGERGRPRTSPKDRPRLGSPLSSRAFATRMPVQDSMS